jgi:hypothetical protein
MARLKLYYPVDEITPNLFTQGKEFMTEDNVEYIGRYHRYITGEIYTESNWDVRKSKRLIKYVENVTKQSFVYDTLQPNLTLKYIQPNTHSVTISKNDISTGYITRYFIKKINNENIIEINQIQYNAWLQDVIEKKMHIALSLTWYISGTIEDETSGVVTIPGVISKNQKQVSYASKTLPGLSNLLTNFIEYYTDNDYSVPVDINGLDS